MKSHRFTPQFYEIAPQMVTFVRSEAEIAQRKQQVRLTDGSISHCRSGRAVKLHRSRNASEGYVAGMTVATIQTISASALWQNWAVRYSLNRLDGIECRVDSMFFQIDSAARVESRGLEVAQCAAVNLSLTLKLWVLHTVQY
jgi:uncharacterized protein YqfB (UPF0267 family)